MSASPGVGSTFSDVGACGLGDRLLVLGLGLGLGGGLVGGALAGAAAAAGGEQREHEQGGDGESIGSSQTGASARHCADHGAAMAHRPRPAGWTRAQKLRAPSGRSTRVGRCPRGSSAPSSPCSPSASPCTRRMPLIGPGDGPIDHAIASWVYTGVMWVGSAMCLLAAAVAAPRARRVGAHRPRPAASGPAATSCGRCGSAPSRTRPTRASPTASTSAATSRSTPACWCCCARACARSAPRSGSTARSAAWPPPRSWPRSSSPRWPGSPRATRSTSPSTSPIRSATSCSSRSSSWPSASTAGAWTARGCCSASGSWPTSSPTRSSATSRPSAPTSRARGSTRCGPSARC